MNKILDNYNKNILSIKNSISIYEYLSAQAKNMDATVLLRSQYVLIVSAFDTYVHSVVIKRIIEQYFSENDEFSISLDIPLSLSYEMRKLNETQQKEKLYLFLLDKLSKDSFQSPKSIEYAFSIIGIGKIWTLLGNEMQMKPEDVKSMLAIIVKRRNKIAHESDWNSILNKYEDIEINDVIMCQEFIDAMVNALAHIVSNSNQ